MPKLKPKIRVCTPILMPPASHLCQECAVDHPSTDPHNAQSLFYQTKFGMENKRSANWIDAMAHCSDDIKKHWIDQLKAMDVDIEGGKILPRKYYDKMKTK